MRLTHCDPVNPFPATESGWANRNDIAVVRILLTNGNNYVLGRVTLMNAAGEAIEVNVCSYQYDVRFHKKLIIPASRLHPSVACVFGSYLRIEDIEEAITPYEIKPALRVPQAN